MSHAPGIGGPSIDGPSIDAARAVREGEELPQERLESILRERVPGYEGELSVAQFPSGHSNLTYLLSWKEGGRTVERVLRRPPFGNQVKTAHDMGREHRILSMLTAPSPSGAPWLPQAPRPILHVEDDDLFGAPFYVMDRIAGVVLRRKLPSGIVLDEGTNASLSAAFVDQLAALHGLPWESIGLGAIAKPEGYVERQVGGWTKRWLAARTDDVADVDAVSAWLAANQPPAVTPALIHNDFKYDNLVLDPAELTRIVGILDWEMATVGDPLMDLATSLAYWVQADDPPPIVAFAFGPTHLPGSPRRMEIAEAYAAKTRRSLEHLRFYYAFALFKNAVVAQQIYARYVRGLTKDERFAAMGFAVGLLGAEARRVAEGGSV